MALENSTTSMSAWLATEVLSAQFLEAYKPQLRFFRHIHVNRNAIARTEKKVFRVKSDPGQAPAGPGESVNLSNTYQVSPASNIECTSTEFVGDLSQFSFQSIADTLGLDLNVVAETLTNGSQVQCEQLLAPFVADLVYRAYRAADAAALALWSGIANSVGASGSDWTLARMLAPRYQFRIQQPHRPIGEAEYWMPEIGISDVETEVLATAGGVQGAIWGTPQAAYDIARNPGMTFMMDGLLGSFLGHRVYTIDPEMNVTANALADVLGFFGVPGVAGVSPDDPSIAGLCGAFAFYERMAYRVDYAPAFAGRGGMARSIWHGAFFECSDADGVKLIIDAP